MTQHACIKLNGLELSVNLGWPQGERVKQQIVTLDATIYFAKAPLACTSDNLDDTVCYDKLVEKIKSYLIARNFRLLEHLGHELHQIIKTNFPADTRVKINVTKKPAILNLTGGVTFCYSDLESPWSS